MFVFKKQVSHIGGWLTHDEGNFLYKISKEIPKGGIIIEIGSWKGRSTVCLASGVKDGNYATIYAVDPHDAGDSPEIKKIFKKVSTYKEFIDNLKEAGVSKYVTTIKDTSENFAKKFNHVVDFVFVDGSHEYEFVKNDFEFWFPKLRNGGLMVFHDCWHAKGVQLFTSKILINSSRIKNPKIIDTMTVVEKTQKNDYLNRLQNQLFVVYRFLFGWIGTIKSTFFGGMVMK